MICVCDYFQVIAVVMFNVMVGVLICYNTKLINIIVKGFTVLMEGQHRYELVHQEIKDMVKEIVDDYTSGSESDENDRHPRTEEEEKDREFVKPRRGIYTVATNDEGLHTLVESDQ